MISATVAPERGHRGVSFGDSVSLVFASRRCGDNSAYIQQQGYGRLMNIHTRYVNPLRIPFSPFAALTWTPRPQSIQCISLCPCADHEAWQQAMYPFVTFPQRIYRRMVPYPTSLVNCSVVSLRELALVNGL